MVHQQNSIVVANVSSYNILLDVNFKELTYEGKVRIQVDCQNDLTLNSVGLTILTVDHSGKNLQFRHDAVIAKHAYDRAVEMGLGQKLDLVL